MFNSSEVAIEHSLKVMILSLGGSETLNIKKSELFKHEAECSCLEQLCFPGNWVTQSWLKSSLAFALRS